MNLAKIDLIAINSRTLKVFMPQYLMVMEAGKSQNMQCVNFMFTWMKNLKMQRQKLKLNKQSRKLIAELKKIGLMLLNSHLIRVILI